MKTFEMYLVFTIIALGTLLSTCSGFDLKLFSDEMLRLHNEKRDRHGVGALHLDSEMCNKIYECQELNSLVEGETWIISDNVCYLVYKSKDITQETAEKVFLSWYKQGEGYDYTKEPEDELADHFTQIVWNDTKKMGLAIIQKNDEKWIVVSYYPAGNQTEEYVDNVKAPILYDDYLMNVQNVEK